MLNLDKPIVFFDTESTGVSVSEDRVVQFAAVKYIPGMDTPDASLNFLINPGIPIPLQASLIHGMYDKDVSACPDFSARSGNIYCFLKDCHIAGYNVSRFDIPLLEYEFARCSASFPPVLSVFDVMQLIYKYHPRTLKASVQHYIPGYQYKAHDALEDSVSAYELLKAMKSVHDMNDISAFSTSSLLKYADVAGYIVYNDASLPVFNFGKYKNELISNHVPFCRWMIDTKSFPLSTTGFIKSYLLI